VGEHVQAFWGSAWFSVLLVFWLHLFEVVGHKNAKLYAKTKNLHILIRKYVFNFEIKVISK
jgi:hypothetical protein